MVLLRQPECRIHTNVRLTKFNHMFVLYVLLQIKGKRASDFRAELGYHASDEVVHRENLALLLAGGYLGGQGGCGNWVVGRVAVIRWG